MPRLPPGFRTWLSPRGRIPRRVYWLHYVLPCVGGMLVLTVAILGAVPRLVQAISGGQAPTLGGRLGGLALLAVALAIFLFLVWGSLVAGVKRMHDRGHWGGWYVAYILFGMARAVAEVFVVVPGWIVLVDVLVGLGFLIELGFRQGTDGPNRYGPDPLDLDPAPVEARALPPDLLPR